MVRFGCRSSGWFRSNRIQCDDLRGPLRFSLTQIFEKQMGVVVKLRRYFTPDTMGFVDDFFVLHIKVPILFPAVRPVCTAPEARSPDSYRSARRFE